MLAALMSGFVLSQAYRTLAGILGLPVQAELALSPQELGVFAAMFHLAFGITQIGMGVALDMHGVRRVILAVSPFSVVGAAMSSLAQDFPWLLLGQALIGIGCAPAFLVCTLLLARAFPAERFAALSGMVLGVGGLGLVVTGTPMAWLIEWGSWRTVFTLLAVASALSWIAMFAVVGRDAPAKGAPRESLGQALRGFGGLFLLPHTAGIMVLGSLVYAAFLTVRGLWLGPMLIEREGYTLVQSGNVALVMSLVALFSPPLFGRLDPGPLRRPRWLIAGTLALAALFLVLGWARGAVISAVLPLVIAALSGFAVLQYADVRSAYPPSLTGRAMSVFTMAMFLGIGIMQWVTGLVAAFAQRMGWDIFATVYTFIFGCLAAGAAAYAWLPRPPAQHAPD
ncbi:MFS transporter [Verticiella sediminum]|uniref:MFS transporter n=2 Tax=Verticiella sediminum TaxID=1247510 RepID=A0A556ASE1_9BURK|nr:MFS transporter [Verticiella sediminum]